MAEYVKVTRYALRQGADFIKVMVTGNDYRSLIYLILEVFVFPMSGVVGLMLPLVVMPVHKLADGE